MKNGQPINLKFFLRVISLLGLEKEKYLMTSTIEDANERLSGDLLNAVIEDNRGNSMAVSGFSVLQPLAQLALAAEGRAHQELLWAIGLPDNRAVEYIFRTRRISNMPQTTGFQLRTASKIYVRSGLKINPQFSTKLEQVFRSEIQEINFNNKHKAANEMNGWVESKTDKHIKNLVDPESLNSDTRVVMLNAIYFKAKWKVPFKRDLTKVEEFHVSDSTSIELDVMYRTGPMNYGNSELLSAELVELPYACHGATFLVILPNTIEGLLPLIKRLKDPAAFRLAVSSLRPEPEVHLHLPKFKIETTIDVALYLQKIGIKRVFTPGKAGLTKLLEGADETVYVSNAIQKAFFEINEEGTEAAASNSVGISVMSAHHPIDFYANHPFLFYVSFNGSTIFSGVFAGPERGFRI